MRYIVTYEKEILEFFLKMNTIFDKLTYPIMYDDKFSGIMEITSKQIEIILGNIIIQSIITEFEQENQKRKIHDDTITIVDYEDEFD